MPVLSKSEHPPAEEATETVFVNGSIYMVDPAFSKATALAVKGQNILYAGSSPEQAAAAVSPRARRVDLGGKTVIPGIIEGHMHFLSEGEKLSEIDIFWKPKEEILRLVALEAQSRKPGEWITGRGWNHEAWRENRWPAKEDLDAVAPDNPVAFTRADAHSIWVNSAALRAAGIDKNTPDPRGGEILRTPDGEPQGILVDTPIFTVRAVMPPMDEEQTCRAYQKAQAELFRYGITSLVNASQTLRNHEILKKAYQDGKLKIRVYEMLAAHKGQDLRYLQAGNKPFSGLYGERLTLRALKIIGDGSLGSRSAWLLRDYADRPGHTGNGRYSDEQLGAMITRARDNGFQACVHAIGDAATRQAVAVMEKVLQKQPLPDHRYRIEHFQTVQPENLAKAARLGIIPSMQTIHAVSDRKMAELRLAPETLERSYIWRDVIKSCGLFVNGSDAPMESVNPFAGMHAAVTRTDGAGDPPGGWRPEQKLTREEALKSYTIWAAYAEFNETRKGSLEPGKLADFAVLDRDIMTCPESEIKDTRVLMTVVGGETVYEKAP